MMGRFGAPSRSPYACTKFAIQGLSECLRAEMKEWNVKVSIIEPGNFVAGIKKYRNYAYKNTLY
jgi:3-hydroxybutyrate dehydrogenase